MARETEKRKERRERIEQAAYELLAERGYKSTSMLAVAQRAKVSNETLYRWYGSKAGLFETLIEANADVVRARLQAESAREPDDPLETLRSIAPVLLAMVTGERAVTLNRAAASDVWETGTLGRAIAARGRESVVPLIRELLARAMAGGQLDGDDPDAAAQDFVFLLIGDRQVRRVIGALAPLSDNDLEAEAASAVEKFLRLHGRPRGRPRGRPKGRSQGRR